MQLRADETRELAQRVEALGYSTLWIPDTVGRDPFVSASTMLAATSDLVLATGIANIFMRHPGSMKQTSMSISEAWEDRFLLGIGSAIGRSPL